MGRGVPALTALLLLAACGGAAPARAVLATGAPAPSEWAVPAWSPAPRTYVVWVVRTEDCLTCQEVDYALRRVQARFGGDVPLLVVHVGRARSETIPREFLRSRRVDAAFLTLSPGAFARRFGDPVVPALHVVDGGVIAWSSADLRSRGALRVPLDSLVAGFRRGAGLPAGA